MEILRGSDWRRQLSGRRSDFLEQQDGAVREIIAAVRAGGDQAVAEYTARFDRVALPVERMLVSAQEFESAAEQVDLAARQALLAAQVAITRYHQAGLRNDWLQTAADGSILGQRFTPLQRVGVYVPGGTAGYPSSVLMSVIPAQVAGVEEIVICTPPRPDGSVNPYVLVAADLLGVRQVYRAGGAQAIAAMAFGTERLAPVDKIVGPGNIFVTLAKRLVFGYVDIDMLAGPSEVLILADSSADPRYVAADLLAQAEHDALAQSILITTDAQLAASVQVELELQLATLTRCEIAAQSIRSYGRIVLVQDLVEGVELANQFAPEHLELMVEDPWSLLGQIKHAGAIFLGPVSPEPIGDYLAGPSHVLPTGGTARFASGLSVDSFRKSSSLIALSRAGFLASQAAATELAEVEGLTAHANAMRVRCENDGRYNKRTIRAVECRH